MKKTRKAFTLIEMVIVLFIISLLLLIMIPNLAAQRKNADTRSEEAFKTTIRTQKELYEDNHDGATPTLNKLEDEHYISKKQAEKISTIKGLKEEIEKPAEIPANTTDAKS